MQKQGKIICIDWGIFSHRAIFSSIKNKDIPIEYTCLSMIIASLRRVGVNPEDEIILAIDSRGSWRKKIDQNYKANRKEFREKFDINWGEAYGRMNSLLEKLDMGTNWRQVKIEHLEADDIMAVACRYYADKSVILVTSDGDMEQLTAYPNVKVFSPLSKRYKVIKNPYKTLAKRIECEKSDNLVNPILNSQDYEKRKQIVSLLELPDFVESQCIEQFKNFQSKYGDLEEIPFRSMREKIGGLYNDKSKVVTFHSCITAKKKKKRKSNDKRRKKNDI